MAEKPIFVTQPHLPPLEEFIPYLQQIWDSRVLTNKGPFHQQLERALCEYLGVEHLALFANGTLALVTALQALRITGEVITTPYSFVATAHSLLWNGIKPVFVDIDPKTLNLDPARIEAAITPQTTAIMPVHCYGNPCDVDAIQAIADNYNLKVIYDAAHAFGVQCHCGSVLKHGDLSALSFHATKVFNTFEGGALVCPDARTKQHIDNLKNFGFVNETTVVAPGINAKMSEFNAALGLLQLEHVDEALARRRVIDQTYRELLKGVPGITCVGQSGQKVANYAYFPILVEPAYPLTRDALYERLREQGIHGRRYFYPLISDFPMYRGLPSAQSSNLPVATAVAQKVLCLPIYPALTDAQTDCTVLCCAAGRSSHGSGGLDPPAGHSTQSREGAAAMLVVGAGGLAAELLQVLLWNDTADGVACFDDQTHGQTAALYGRFPVLRTLDDVHRHWEQHGPTFVLGVGDPRARNELAQRFVRAGGHLFSLISSHALVARLGTRIGEGVVVMPHAIVMVDADVRHGALVGKAALVSHHVTLGDYCTVSPGARLLGHATVGALTEIGTNAVVLPRVRVGARCKVGAGAIVTRDVPDDATVIGNPAESVRAALRRARRES